MARARTLAPLLTTLTLALLAAAPEGRAQAPAAEDTRPVPDGTVRFETGSSRITAESEKALDRIAAYIKSQPVADIVVIGHTDRHGGQQTNLRLSKDRARKVRTELMKRKVPGRRISVRGVGYSEPISIAASKEADDLNRRVEVWVGTREAIAEVTFRHRDFESQKPASSEWDRAEVGDELRRLFRVRARERSAGEVTFPDGKTLFLGPGAQAVIYGKDDKKRSTGPVADVTLEEGRVISRLGPERVMIDTDDGRFVLRSARTRLNASEDDQRTTISVFEGRAKVYGGRGSKDVEAGYGTVVERGKVPEDPTPLPPPPTWADRDSVVGFAGRPLRIDWSPAIAHPGALVEIGDVDDPTLEHPYEMRAVSGPGVTVSDLPPGAYRVRVSSVDERGIVGMPGQGRTLVVLPTPEAVRGQLSWLGDGWSLSEPGPVRLPGATNAKAEWTGGAGQPLPSTIEVGPGTTRLQVQLTNDAGTVLGEGRAKIVVRPVSVKLVEVESAVPSGDQDEVTFVVEVIDREGLPEDDLRLATGDPDIGVLEMPVEDPTWMLPLTRPRTATTTYSSIGEGRYRVKWTGDRTQGSSARYVLVYDPARNVGQHVLLPVVGRLEPPPVDAEGRPRLVIEQGLHFALTGGVEIARSDVHPGFRAEVGWTVVAADTLRLSLGIEAGYTRASVDAGSVAMFPMMGRASVAFLVGPMRPYLGFSAGARFLDASLDDPNLTVELETPKAAMEGFIGLGAHFSGLEIFVEGRYGPTRITRAPGFGDVGEPGIYGGLRYFLEKG